MEDTYDPNWRPLTPIQVEQALSEALRARREAVDTVRDKADAAARAKVAFKVDFAKSRTEFRFRSGQNGIKAAIDVVDDHATVACADAMLAAELADAGLLAARENSRALEYRIDGLRTLATSLRQVT